MDNDNHNQFNSLDEDHQLDDDQKDQSGFDLTGLGANDNDAFDEQEDNGFDDVEDANDQNNLGK